MLARGDSVDITGRDRAKAEAAAEALGAGATGLGVDLSKPHDIAAALAECRGRDHIVITAILRDANTVRDYDIDRAIKLVDDEAGWLYRRDPRAAAQAHPGCLDRAVRRPRQGAALSGLDDGDLRQRAVTTMVHTLAMELAPMRVNAIHPGIVGDSPAWAERRGAERPNRPHAHERLATMNDVASAALFLLDNQSINGVNLNIDNGWLLT